MYEFFKLNKQKIVAILIILIGFLVAKYISSYVTSFFSKELRIKEIYDTYDAFTGGNWGNQRVILKMLLTKFFTFTIITYLTVCIIFRKQ